MGRTWPLIRGTGLEDWKSLMVWQEVRAGAQRPQGPYIMGVQDSTEGELQGPGPGPGQGGEWEGDPMGRGAGVEDGWGRFQKFGCEELRDRMETGGDRGLGLIEVCVSFMQGRLELGCMLPGKLPWRRCLDSREEASSEPLRYNWKRLSCPAEGTG